MAEKFNFELVTPERRLVQAEVESVTAPGELGEFGVLPGHRPLLTLLKTGVLTFVQNGAAERVAISGGYAEVSEEGVRVLVESAELSGEIVTAEAEETLARAEADIKKLDPIEQAEALAQAQAARDLAQARILAARKT
ncbi:MAG: ATP synthase F1 subunit epsilon [Deltaproteobacteria bacterium RBG_13_61_14]|nr:MAG: ATP synthase F1 subunit epsilon [Deltaproteobacteria bacterium RBG_13_61_14]